MKNENIYTRKAFLKASGIATAGLAFGLSAKSYGKVMGANDRIQFAVIGLHGRGHAHLGSINKLKDGIITHVCDVDSRVLKERSDKAKKITGNDQIKSDSDFRKILDSKDVDAITIATPSHWHTAMALLGVKSGKHVYVEKPFSLNPHEGDLMVAAQKKYPHLIMQMGNQQRSASTSIEAVQLIKEGIIGEVYYGKAWYSNGRGTIGRGKPVSVPDRLDWDLWQGPAPRETYKDNIVHYNWHWFRHWGDGEINNNGLHELDFCRWALGIDHFPTKVTSSGGRYAFKDDDWQFFDTQIASFEYGKDKLLDWEGSSCNPYQFWGKGRGSLIRGTKGSMIVDRSGYWIYDMKNKLIKEKKESGEDMATATNDTIGGGVLTDKHFLNFVESIKGKANPFSPMSEAQKSNRICHLGNIAQIVGKSLDIDPTTGAILGNAEAMKYWKRDYEPGWEPEI